MEQEAVGREQASLESQLGSLRAQINHLNLEVEEQKAEVKLNIYSGKFISEDVIVILSLLQVASVRNNHDQAQSNLNLIRLNMKECDS